MTLKHSWVNDAKTDLNEVDSEGVKLKCLMRVSKSGPLYFR